MENHAADELNVEMSHTRYANRRFANGRKSFGQNFFQNFFNFFITLFF